MNQWNVGFQAGLTVTNNSDAVVSGWTLTWSFPNRQQIDTLWNGDWSQSGSAVTVG